MEDIVTPEEEMKSYLEIAAAAVDRNTEIVTPETLGQNFLLHISKDGNIRKWVPVVGTRQGKTEDRTMARITVAPTILGCVIGYASTEHDVIELASTGKKDQTGYLGGYYIYQFEFAAALRPNPRLVYDVEASDEHWLVSYSRDTIEYKATIVGKMFYEGMTLLPRTGKGPFHTGRLMIDVWKPEGFRFSKKYFLEKGFWQIDGPMDKNVESWQDDEAFIVNTISKGEFNKSKMLAANLLGYQEPPPAYLNW